MSLYKTIIIVSLLVWTGFVIAISFMEAPLKFTAPGITVELGLGIGRIVFHALNLVEWLFAISILISSIYIRSQTVVRYFFLITLLILIYQTAILLPHLDERAEQLLTGNPAPASYHHILYIIIEFVKVVCLLMAAILFINKNLKNDDSSGNSGKD